MIEYVKKLPKEFLDLAARAGGIARKLNMPAYLVGGFVRDLLLGVKNLDLDIVIEGDGIKFAEILADVSKVKVVRHKRFGTATLLFNDGLKIDVATARSEKYPHPASLPVVSRGSLREDLARRDFTINAMALSISDHDFGRIVDFFGGRQDLEKKKVRVLHELSFIDDPTRILRAIRFEKRYGFNIESSTLTHLKSAVKSGALQKVQPHRLRDELILLFKEENPLRQIKRLRQLAGFGFISSALTVNETTYRLLISVGASIRWMKKSDPARRPLDRWLIYFTGLLNGLDTAEVEDLCARFAFRAGDKKRILSFISITPAVIGALKRPALKPAKIFSILEPLSYEVIVLIKSKYRQALVQRHIEDFFEVYNGVRLSICGDDLRCLGLPPGPGYKKIFTKVLEAKLNGLVMTKEQELALIAQLVKNERIT